MGFGLGILIQDGWINEAYKPIGIQERLCLPIGKVPLSLA